MLTGCGHEPTADVRHPTRDVMQASRVSPKTERRIFAWVSLALSRFPDFLHNAWPGMMRTSILRQQSFLSLRYLALSHDHEHNN
jgi:hypothetical protein